MQLLRITFVLALSFCVTSILKAQSSRPVDKPADASAELLGDRFASKASGVAFRPPRGGVVTRRLGAGLDIAQFVNAEEKWILKSSRLIFDRSTPLVQNDNPITPLEDESLRALLPSTARQWVASTVGAKLLRQEVLNVGKYDVGLIAMRQTQGSQVWLKQQALVKVTDKLYYVFELTTPSTWSTVDDEKNQADPSERLAVDIFDHVLDSVEILDQSALAADRNDRLFRTRTLMVNIPRKLPQVIEPEQFLRIAKDGKEIGWVYVVEMAADRAGQSGYLVASVSETVTTQKIKNRVEWESFHAADKDSREVFASISTLARLGAAGEWIVDANTATEWGNSGKRVGRVVERRNGQVELDERGQPIVRMGQTYPLEVFQITRSNEIAKPDRILRDLPPFYFPQVLNHLLPRLVPLNEPKGYLIGMWVSSEREIIYRYLDVEAEKDVEFAGKHFQAIVVKDRIGLEGEPTFHYFTPEGKYLGNHATATGVTTIVSDQKTLSKLWPDATLVKPHVLDRAAQDPIERAERK